MTNSVQSAPVIRFQNFSVNLDTGEVWKNGIRLKLQDQPFKVLVALLQRPGEVVSREELHKLIWPRESFGDFDHAISLAINKLRAALGDSADVPHLVETLPRRGYRFIATVDECNPHQPASPPTVQSHVERVVPPTATIGWRFARPVWLGLLAVAFVAILLVALNVRTVRQRFLTGRQSPIDSIAVLPVENFSGDANQEFFADGMTDALIADLAQIKAIKVISRTSVMHYKGTNETLPQIAKELGVNGIVEASVVRSGDHVRLTVQLIDARQDRHLWAKKYEREMTDVLALQSELVQTIAAEIRAQVTPQESALLKTTRRIDPQVYDTTFKGKATIEYATREQQIRHAIELFQEAVDRDPTYAPAWAGLGEALWTSAATGFEFVAPDDVRDKAIAAADRALELDPNLPDAHQTRAIIAWDAEWDLVKAQQEFEKALELRPGYAAAHNLYGQMLVNVLSSPDEARRHIDRAGDLDPLSPWNDINLVGWWNYQGRPDKAVEAAERMRQRDPTLWIIPWLIGGAHLLANQPDNVIADEQAALRLLDPERPPAVLAPLGLAYGLAGRQADAQRILAELKQTSKSHYVSPYYVAVVYSGLRRMDEAFPLLDQALRQRTPYLQGCVRYESFSIALRRDPRWRPFVERLRQQVRLPTGTPNPYL